MHILLTINQFLMTHKQKLIIKVLVVSRTLKLEYYQFQHKFRSVNPNYPFKFSNCTYSLVVFILVSFLLKPISYVLHCGTRFVDIPPRLYRNTFYVHNVNPTLPLTCIHLKYSHKLKLKYIPPQRFSSNKYL